MVTTNKMVLGNIAEIITGPFGSMLHQSDYTETGIPVIMPQDIGNRVLEKGKIAHVGQADAERLARYQVIENDIVYARRGDVEKHAFIYKEDEGALCGTGCMRVRVDPRKANPLYISFYLNRSESKRWISQHAVGSNMPNLNTQILSDVPLDLPPVSVQNSIANTLELLDLKIQTNRVICTELESIAKTIYDYWFTQFDFPNAEGKPYRSSGGKMVWNEQLKREIPEGWEITTVGDITICHDSERIPVNGAERDTMKGDIPYYGATCQMGSVDRAIFNGDYVLMAEDGSVMDADGFPNLQRISGPAWVNNHAHVLEPAKGYSCRLLMLILKQIPVVMIKTGSIQMKINQENMNSYKIVAIPAKLIEKVNNILQSIDTQIIHLQAENNELSKLRNWLLPMLMNGQATIE